MRLTLIFVPLFATVAFIYILYPVAIRVGLTDKPSHRKQHKEFTPLIGGLAIYSALLPTLSLFQINFPHLLAYAAAATLLVVVGLIDDFRNLGVKIRLLAQIVATLIMTEIAGVNVQDLGDLFGTGNVELDIYATAFTVFAVVGGINAFNMIDGIDGLAGSLTLTSILTLAVVSWIFQFGGVLDFAVILIALISAFLLFNLRIFGRSNAKIFLGDTGSTLFGFTVCWLAIYASQSEHRLIPPTIVLWIIAVPLFDSVCIMLRRISKGRSPFAPDREHLHHILSLAGYSVNQTLLLLVAFSVILSTTSIAAFYILNIPEGILFISFLLLFGCHYWGMNHAWKMMKIARYLRSKRAVHERFLDRRQQDRRQVIKLSSAVDRRTLLDRRVLVERRFVPTEKQLEKIFVKKSKKRSKLRKKKSSKARRQANSNG